MTDVRQAIGRELGWMSPSAAEDDNFVAILLLGSVATLLYCRFGRAAQAAA